MLVFIQTLCAPEGAPKNTNGNTLKDTLKDTSGDTHRSESFLNSILVLSGASCAEELDESEIERYSRYAAHPLDLNAQSYSRLTASGLLTAFQMNSLIEYRQEYGDILSYSELALISGFGTDVSNALKEFTILKSRLAPGQKENRRLDASVMLRTALRQESSRNEHKEGGKVEIAYGDRFEFNWALRNSYDNSRIGPGTISAAYYGKRFPGKIVAGDFSARFGQGLSQWSGFSINSLGSVSSFAKNGGGIAATSSFSSTLCGIAADVTAGKFTFSAACSFKNGTIGIGNVNWTGRVISAGVTATSENAGADIRLGLKDLSIFAEISTNWKWAPAAVAGIIWIPAYGKKLAVRGHYYSPGFRKEYSGAAVCFENSWLCSSAEAAWNFSTTRARYKAAMKLRPEFTTGNLSVKPSVTLSSRYIPAEENSVRAGMRAEVKSSLRGFEINARYETLHCAGTSWLWYLEPGYTGGSRLTADTVNKGTAGTGSFGIWGRFTLFKVDNWEDRIYIYERDAPQSFNVPAYYGRGWAGAVVVSLKFGPQGRNALHARFSALQYFNDKPNRLEFKIQYSRRL